MIPIKATIDDLDSLLRFLRPTFGWVDLTKVKATLGSKVTDNRKLEAARYLGFVDRDTQNIRITDQGRAYGSGQNVEARTLIMREQLAKASLYLETISWMYHSNKSEPTKTDVGEQWHKYHTNLLQGAQGAALTDGVIFFMRVAEAAGLGKFITAGKNRPETKFRGDRPAIEEFAQSYLLADSEKSSPDDSPSDGEAAGQNPSELSTVTSQLVEPDMIAAPAAGRVQVGSPNVHAHTSPTVNINLEFHIAADTTAETVAEIFKNLRKYVLSPD
jgi:hypothetical protein